MSAQEQQTIASNPPPDEARPGGIRPRLATEPSGPRALELPLVHPLRGSSSGHLDEARAVDADTEQDALDTLGETKLRSRTSASWRSPTRFVRPRKPKVDTVTTITYD